MRRTLSAVVLVLAFCCPVSGGIIHNPAPTPPTQDAVAPTADAETTVVETTGVETAAPGLSDSLTELTLDLLAILPTLF